MAKIEFKAKIKRVYNTDETLAWEYVKVPKIRHVHCDMDAFRDSKKYGSYANSDLFQSLVTRALKDNGVKEVIRLDQIPACVKLDTTGFLATVSIEI